MRNWIFFLFAGLVLAQAPYQPMENVGAANLPTQRIGVNDLIAVSVYRSPEFTRTVRVGADGAIELPLLKERIKAEGMMPHELEETIAQALDEGGLLVDPIVEVTVAEYASRPINVMGAVHKPLTFQAVGRVKLLDALARAEGLLPTASNQVLVTLPYRAGGQGDPMVRRIPVKGLIDDAEPELNLLLRGGEEVRVPEAGRVFVIGNVKKPGSYAVPNPADATVMKMIAIAEGLTPYYRRKAYIYREDRDHGAKHEIEIELARIMKREIPDVPLEVNDVLYIPDNPGKRTRNKVLGRTLGFAAATVSGILIWQR